MISLLASNDSLLEPRHPCADCAVRLLAICGVLNSDELGDLKRASADIAFAAGATITYEGDVAKHVYNLTSGTLRLSKLLPDGRRQIAGFLFPGDFLGITMEDEHAFTVEAIGPATLCRFARSRFDGFVEAHPHLERRLYALAAHELAAARQQLVLLGRKTAAERVASFLLMLADRYKTTLDALSASEVVLPMSRSDIADYLGLRIETVSREITALKASRLIQLTTTHNIRLLDRERLEMMAKG